VTEPLRDALGGAGTLFRGAARVLRTPRLFLLGAVPPLITSLVFVTALVILIANTSGLVAALTPFAGDWDPFWRGLLRLALGVAMVGAAVLVMVVAFTTVTLAVGSPIYDKIAEAVEAESDEAAQVPAEGRGASVVRSVRQSLAVVLLSLLISVAAFATGFLPLIGQVLAPVVATLLGGWVVTVELTAVACDRRGLRTLSQRHGVLRRRRARVLGFAVPTFLLLAIPFVAIAVFPAAAAGGTILTRDIFAEGPRTGPSSPH
jgi:CysZ protein